jgi:hypothetical protein
MKIENVDSFNVKSMFKKFFLLSLYVVVIFCKAKAQHYGTAAGIRIANSDISRTLGLSVQQRVADKFTVEGILQTDFNRNTMASLLLERHHSLISKRFNYYYGAGFAVGNEESFVKNPLTKEIIHTYGNSISGLDLIAGIEMKISKAVISLDYKPNINISGREEFFHGQVGISARTVLVKSSEQKRKQRLRRKRKQSTKQAISKSFTEIFKK